MALQDAKELAHDATIPCGIALISSHLRPIATGSGRPGWVQRVVR